MSCTKTFAQCQEHIQHIIDRIENTERANRTQLTYIRRNILCYSWLLHESNRVVDRELLETLVGQTLRFNVQDYIHELLVDERATPIGSSNFQGAHLPKTFSLCPEFADAIAHALENSYGDMKSPQEVLGGNLNLTDLLQLFLMPGDTQLINTLSRAFAHAFSNSGVKISRLTDIDELESHYSTHELANFARILTFNSWSFILFAYPSDFALTTGDMRKIRLFLSDIRMMLLANNPEKYPGVHSLLVTTGVDKPEDVDDIPQASRIHYMWAFSAVRLILLLEKIFHGFGKNDGSAFQHFFDPQASIAFSVQEGEHNFSQFLNSNSINTLSSPVSDKDSEIISRDKIKFVVPYFVDKSKRNRDEKFRLAVVHDDSGCRLYKLNDGISIPSDYIFKNGTAFLETTPNEQALESYGSIKKLISEEEREILNRFILDNHAFDYPPKE